MVAQIVFTGLAVFCALDAALVAALAGRLCAQDRVERRRGFGIAGVMLCASLICAIAGGVA
ncbi:hypothetical protein [Methylobacterium sp. D48H]